MKQDRHETRKRAVRVGGLLLALGILTTFTVFAARWVLSLNDAQKLAHFQELLESLGWGGVLVLLAIQYVQIVVAFIPGGPIQIAAGAMYGPLGGLLICLGGTVLAALSIFALVKKFGRRALSLFVDDKDIRQYKFLTDEKRLERLVLLLFFIPGTPKDALTYLFALTPMATGRFLLLSTAARLPAMFTSVLAGDSIIHREWLRAGLLFVGITAVSALGLLLHRKIPGLRKSPERDETSRG